MADRCPQSSDRDVVVASRAFQDRIKRKHGIDWYHLKIQSKVYKAKRAIQMLKTGLSLALDSNERGDNNWVRHLQPLVNAHNHEFVWGMGYR
jgi:hypothetical protein